MRVLLRIRNHGLPATKKSRTLTLFAKPKAKTTLRKRKARPVPPEMERPFAQA